MFPHERSLVKDYADRPFAILGVNSDKDLDQLHEKNAAENITWRSFWNGPEGTGGPISKQWNVAGWPTLYLIDHEGVIRHKFLGNPGNDIIDGHIADLVAKAEAATGN